MLSPNDKIIASSANLIGRMVFNDPERRNALSIHMWEAIPAVLEAFRKDAAVRVCVISGAGDRAFVSGANLNDVGNRQSGADVQAQFEEYSTRAWGALDSFEKPMIAKIQGYCLGAGVGIATKADLRIASTDAVFGIPAARIGLAYPTELLRSLISLVGPSAAKSMLFTGRRLTATEALRVGLVDELAPAADLDARVDALAEQIAANAPLTIRAAKAAINHLSGPAGDAKLLDALNRACLSSADHAEGLQAYREKRDPVFVGS